MIVWPKGRHLLALKKRKTETDILIPQRWNAFHNNNYLIVMNWTHWWFGLISEYERHSRILFWNYLFHEVKLVIALQIWNVCVRIFISSEELYGFIGEIDNQIGIFFRARAVDFLMTGNNLRERKSNNKQPMEQWICNIDKSKHKRTLQSSC